MFSRARIRIRVPLKWSPDQSRQARPFATHSSSTAASTTIPTSPLSPLGTLTSEIDKISPRFNIRSDEIEILKSPSQFYDTLKTKILNAKRIVYLSTLYIGKTEHELIQVLREALHNSPTLKISVLTDALRGTRETPNPSCASLLAPLITEFGPDRVQIRMFHTPNLTGVRKSIVPKRINEGWGLQHMKLYGIDDELILSGANLSEDYFTNRQDRYHIFKSEAITNYFHALHSSICLLSFDVLPTTNLAGYTMVWPKTNAAPSPLTNTREFKAKATALLTPLLTPNRSPVTPPTSDTVVYPLIQFTPLLSPDTSTELPVLQTVLRALSDKQFAGASWTFTAGYFNMTPGFKRLLLATKPAHGTVIAASPWANGFYGSPGVSGMLPAAYTHLSKHFVNEVRRKELDSQIQLYEWRRGTIGEPRGWTYHAKGLWVSLPGESDPSLSVVGSSNYTKRSYELDLEANILILTSDESLKRRLGEETRWLREYATPVDRNEYDKPDRRVSWKVRLAMWAVRILGGAL